MAWIKMFPLLFLLGCGSAAPISEWDEEGNSDNSEVSNAGETDALNEPTYNWRDLRDFLADYAGALCDGIKDCCPDTTSYQKCMAGPNYLSPPYPKIETTSNLYFETPRNQIYLPIHERVVDRILPAVSQSNLRQTQWGQPGAEMPTKRVMSRVED